MIKFGTDGWRAVISEDFTFENVRKVSQAISEYLKGKYSSISVVVGFDTRFLSDVYAKLISEVLCGNNIKVILTSKFASTPMVSYTIRNRHLQGGVMVTASHNPPQFNGIKFKPDFAGSATLQETRAIEERLGKNPPVVKNYKQAQEEGLLKIEDISLSYRNFITSYLDMDIISKSNLKIVVDTMYGVANKFIPEILKNTNCEVKLIHSEYNPTFGGVNPEPIPNNLSELINIMKNSNFDLGIAIDGDGDRIGAVTEEGRFIVPGWIISLLLLHFIENKKWTGCVVKTISNSTLIERIAQKFKLKLYETPVGFKYISKLMREEDILIGGEESGGIGYKNFIPERDGILSGLLLLEMLAYRKRSIGDIIQEMEDEFGKFCYARIDLKYPEDKKEKLLSTLRGRPFKELLGSRVVQVKDYDGIKFICEDDSWLLFRLSGTESLLRVYSEANSEEKVKNLLEFGKEYSLGI